MPEAVQKSQREALKKQEFDAAKAVVAAQAKQSKQRKMGNKRPPPTGEGAEEGAGERKRVSFA